MDESKLRAALESLQPALAADGFGLDLVSVSPDGDVDVVLEAKEGACMDCLVPDDMLVAIIQTAMKDREGAVRDVRLQKVGF